MIGFDLPEAGRVELRIYDVLGREVYREMREYPAGRYNVVWNGRSSRGQEAPSGIYIVLLKAGKFTDTRKMVLMK